MDQQVGLRTQALNIERAVDQDVSVEPLYIPVHYQADAGLLTRLPGLPAGIKGTLRGVREIREGLSGQKFDAALWSTWAAKSVPDLVENGPAFFAMDMTPRQMEAMGELYGYGRFRAQFFGGLKRRATDRIYKAAAHFFPWSQYVAESLKQDYGIADQRITVISPGVDTELYRPKQSARRSSDPVRLLFVGGDFYRKGGDLLLRWLRERRGKGIVDCELHAVTRDDKVAPEPGLIVHRGIGNNSSELVDLYQQSDLFVLPTRADCYSLVAMEAMAAGLPVIISDIGGISDIVADNETGFLIAPDDYDALADRLNLLVDDAGMRHRMGGNARLRAEKKFDSRANIKKLVALIKESVGCSAA